MDEALKQAIDRAKELIKTIKHTPIATVNDDGSPHLSPVFAAYGDDMSIYWCSNPDVQHSKNVQRDGRVFMVLFDSMDKGGGLFIKATAKQLDDDQVEAGLAVYNKAIAKFGRPALEPKAVMGEQRLYKATPQILTVNVSSKDANGNVRRDGRAEISLSDLM